MFVGLNGWFSLNKDHVVLWPVDSLSMCVCCTYLAELEPTVQRRLSSLDIHQFLWKEDLHSSYHTFLDTSPRASECSQRMQKFKEVEEEVSNARLLLRLPHQQKTMIYCVSNIVMFGATFKNAHSAPLYK